MLSLCRKRRFRKLPQGLSLVQYGSVADLLVCYLILDIVLRSDASETLKDEYSSLPHTRFSCGKLFSLHTKSHILYTSIP